MNFSHHLAIVCTFFITFHIYISTCSDSVSGGDSGEVMAAANDLAVAHPPGYPLFVIIYNVIGKQILFENKKILAPSISKEDDKLNENDLPFYFNVVSCLLSALGASFITAAALLWTNGDIGASISTSFIVFLSSSIWTYALQTEVFALHNFFVALLLFLLVWYEAKPSLLRALVGAFFCGLSLTNQHTSVLMVVPLAAWIALYRQLGSLKARPIAITLLYLFVFVLGLSPYYFLVWSANHRHSPTSSSSSSSPSSISLITWGNTTTLEGFLHHFFRGDYGTLSLGSKESTYLVKGYTNSLKAWKLFGVDCFEQLGNGVWVVLPVIGIVASFLFSSSTKDVMNRQPPAIIDNVSSSSFQLRVSFVIVICWFVYTIFFHSLSNLPIDEPLFLGVQQRFWMHPFMLVAFFAARGFSFASGCAISFMSKSPVLRFCWNTMLPVSVLTVQLLLNFDAHNERGNRYVENFGKAILDSLPQNAILLTKGDLVVNSVRYLQGIKQYRTDVIVLDQELLTYEWFVERARRKFSSSSSSAPVIIFPGRFYFPGRKDTFDMRIFLAANGVSGSGSGAKSESERRAFFCYGLKEGDYSLLHGNNKNANMFPMELRSSGICEEVVKKGLHDPMNIKKQKDASLWVLELMRSLPSFGRDILVPDSTTTTTVSSVSSLSNEFFAIFRQLFSTSRDFIKLRSNHYKRTEWENVTSSDLSAAFERVSFILNKIFDGQKAKHPELLIVSADGTSSSTATTAVFPPESWTLKQMEETCLPCTQQTEASSFALDQIRIFNRKPTLPCASDTRTVMMCGVYTATRLLDELIRRFPQDATANVHRNRASFIQSLMLFLAPESNKKTNRDLTVKIIESLRACADGLIADGNPEDRGQIVQMKSAADFYAKQLKGM